MRIAIFLKKVLILFNKSLNSFMRICHEKTIYTYTCFENYCMQKKSKRTFFHYERPNYTIFSTEQTELMCENLASLIAPFFAQNVFSWPFGKSLI